MEDTSEKSGVENGESLPPPYPKKEQDESKYPGGMQQGTIMVPQNPGEMQEMAPVTVVQTQSVVCVTNNETDPPLETYFACSLFVLLFCCLPFGIVALVHASQQKTKQFAGDLAGARHAQSQAKWWSYAGFITGLCIIAVVLLCVFIAKPYNN